MEYKCNIIFRINIAAFDSWTSDGDKLVKVRQKMPEGYRIKTGSHPED
jgi:hypothetical protein